MHFFPQIPEKDSAEGRLCATCGSKLSGYSTDSHSSHGVHGSGTYDDLSSILELSSFGIPSLISKGSGLSFGVFALPILGVNIAILVLLGILLSE